MLRKKLDDLAVLGFGFHALVGDRRGQFAMKVNNNWRITFGWDSEGAEAIDLDYEDYHQEASMRGRRERHPEVRPSHPGEIIATGLAETGITRTELAKAMGISRNTLYKLLEGKQSVTAEMALRLAVVWGSSAETWLALQTSYDLWSARHTLDVSGLRPLRAAA